MKKMTGYPSIDKPWLKNYSENDLKIKIPECSVYRYVFDRNQAYPRDIALSYFGKNINYGTLFKKTEECAKSLRKIGIKKGDCVSLFTAGVPEVIYIILACSRIGAIANFVSPLFTKQQIIDRINDTECEWLFVLDGVYSYIEDSIKETCIKKIVVIPSSNSFPFILSKLFYLKSSAKKILSKRNQYGLDYYHWNEFLLMGENYTGEIDADYEKDVPVIMVYSSGTTGASKGILLTNDGINSIIINYLTDLFSYKRGSSFLQMIPVWTSTGAVLSILMPLVLGIKVILEPRYGCESFVSDLVKYKPTITLASTSLWMNAADELCDKNVDFSGLEYPAAGGEKVLPKDEIRLNQFLLDHGCKKIIAKGYGMCELGGTVSTSTGDKNAKVKMGSNGYPILNSIVAAFDIKTDKELKFGEHGEIRVCTPARMKGYYKRPDATSEYFKTDSEGRVWGCTGDIGYVDEDGELFILGRVSDSYKNKDGETIYFFYIEDQILKEECVKQCKVVDIEENGQIKLAAHIVFGDKSVPLKKIHEELKANLPDAMIPDYYKIRKTMPVGKIGKRDAQALKNDREDLISAKEIEEK
ncbi:MAG: acyl--CoA ligase [Treponema sp.]|uniref:class I adenylate-forming enzyme family protein n=1 Tax=Treponema sp. TaxID=166 RepID=UPI00298ED092|nr:class I adenylate-forming enzyme family protein [Treponema sp.]MBR5932399.1 acyl--CoA ligase [Treponema sp.]